MKIKQWFRPIFKILISLKFAIIVMAVITLGMIAATLLEAIYDTPTSQFYVYKHVWFLSALVLFGVNILFVALSRLPWQKRHLPFLLAHLGILVLLYGSWLTFQFGLDGNLSISEGTEDAVVEINDPELLIADGMKIQSIKIGWRPPFVNFEPMDVSEYGLKVTKWLTHAEPDIQFVSDEKSNFSAVHFKLFGGPKAPPFMRRGQDLWLFSGDANWSGRQLGPAQLQIFQTDSQFNAKENPIESKMPGAIKGPKLKLYFDPQKKSLFWNAISSSGNVKKGEIKSFDQMSEENPLTIDPEWKNDVQIQFFSVLPKAKLKSLYKESNVQYGSGAPESAIFIEGLETGATKGEGIWLGLGEKAAFEKEGKSYQIGYFPKRLVLPFAIRLNEFRIEHYEGTQNPMSFASYVTVQNGQPNQMKESQWIKMNEPLKYGGYTFYQASYVPDQPRPTTSIFSVNKDPGRWVKYLGAIILVLGSILFFMQKVKKTKVILT